MFNPCLMFIFRGPTFQCSCPIGYTASFCEISMSNNPCNDNPCSNGATCTLQSLSNYTCSCPLGWKGKTILFFYCKSSQIQWKPLNVITVNDIIRLMWSIHWYHPKPNLGFLQWTNLRACSFNVISSSLSQSDHIKRLPL